MKALLARFPELFILSIGILGVLHGFFKFPTSDLLVIAEIYLLTLVVYLGALNFLENLKLNSLI